MARRLSRLPVAWSDDVVTDAQPPSCQDKPHQIKPNRTEPNRTKGALHDIGGLLLLSSSFGNRPRSKRPISKRLSNKGPISGGEPRKGLPNQGLPNQGHCCNAHVLNGRPPPPDRVTSYWWGLTKYFSPVACFAYCLMISGCNMSSSEMAWV